MKKGNQRGRAEYRIEFQDLSSGVGGPLAASGPGRCVHDLRNDFALLLAVVRPRLPALRYRRCLTMQRRADRALVKGLKPGQRPAQAALKDLHGLFTVLDKGDFPRAHFDRICLRYQELFLPDPGREASEADRESSPPSPEDRKPQPWR